MAESKLLSMFLILAVVQVGLMLFDQNTVQAPSFITFFFGPSTMSTTTFFLMFTGLAIGLSGGVLIALSVIFKYDTMVFAPAVLAILPQFAVLANAWVFINAGIGGMIGVAGTASGTITSLIISPLIIMSVYYTVGWWRGNSFL